MPAANNDAKQMERASHRRAEVVVVVMEATIGVIWGDIRDWVSMGDSLTIDEEEDEKDVVLKERSVGTEESSVSPWCQQG